MNPLPTAAVKCAYVLAVTVGFLLSATLAAQERPFDVTACQLVEHPDRYNEGMVSVDGLITVGAEEFMLHDANCSDEHGKIWLEFGGGVESPGASPSTHLSKNRPRTFESLELPLNQDRDFEALQKLLQAAQKSGKTKMLHATLVGKYFAGKPTPTVDGVVRSGYGRLGCCSLLIIEEVGTVGADIEEPVDFSPVAQVSPKTLAKGCTIAELTVPPREDEDQLERKSLEEEFRYFCTTRRRWRREPFRCRNKVPRRTSRSGCRPSQQPRAWRRIHGNRRMEQRLIASWSTSRTGCCRPRSAETP